MDAPDRSKTEAVAATVPPLRFEGKWEKGTFRIEISADRTNIVAWVRLGEQKKVPVTVIKAYVDRAKIPHLFAASPESFAISLKELKNSPGYKMSLALNGNVHRAEPPVLLGIKPREDKKITANFNPMVDEFKELALAAAPNQDQGFLEKCICRIVEW